MSTLLKQIEDDFDRRVAIRRRMFDHLGIDLDAAHADECFEENRETLLACARCANPDTCERWIDGGCAGAPMFCQARTAYMRLEAMTTLPRMRRMAGAAG